MHIPEVELRPDVTLLGGFAVPGGRFDEILRDTIFAI